MIRLRKSTLSDQPLPYLAPMIIILITVYLYPMIRIVTNSLQWIAGGSEITGLQAYKVLLNDPAFIWAIKNNAVMLLCVPVLVLISLLMGILLYEVKIGSRAYRLFIFLPYILPVPVVGTVFRYILQYNGALNTFLRTVGLDPLAIDWLGSVKWSIFSVMGVFIWKEVGFGALLFLSRLLTVPEDLYDSAKIDGATWLQMHLYITVPQLWGIIEFFAVVQAITVLGWTFPYVYVMTRGGPGYSTLVMDYFIYRTGFEYRNMTIASAGATVLLIVSWVFVFLQRRLIMRMGLKYA